jgi:hypothetical protein
VRLEGLDQLKNQMGSSGIDHATFRLVEQCLIELRYCVPNAREKKASAKIIVTK